MVFYPCCASLLPFFFGYFQPGFRTLVILFGRGTLHRFFFGSRADSAHECPDSPRLRHRIQIQDRVDAGRLTDCLGQPVGGHLWSPGPQVGFHMLLPLRCVARQQRLRQNVRVSQICFALVGDLLRATKAKGHRHWRPYRPPIAASSTGGTCTDRLALEWTSSAVKQL